MVWNSLGLWVFNVYRFNRIQWLQLPFLLRIMRWVTSMLPLFSSLRNFAVVNGKSISPIFTVKQIMLRITWAILAILLVMGCIFMILLIGVCPTSYIMIL
ncbi:hypothetical protein LINGRAHAP2_LOCUS23385 [Linum grandiflorum]